MGTEGTKKAGCEVSEQGPRGSATQYAQLQAELRYIVNTAETGQQQSLTRMVVFTEEPST